METFTLTENVASLRFVEVNGRQFAIAPITILRSRVLPGSRGALFYPADENKRVEEQWNGKPLVSTTHPRSNGQNISANTPEIFQNQEIGRFYKSKVDQQGTNTGEGWFDVELTKKHDSRIYNALLNKQKIEVSTGLYTDNEEAPQNSSFDGTSYTHIARNYRPDHIAILVDETGACSIKDGCGVNNSLNNNADCGTGAGGFHPGNTCAKGGSGGEDGDSTGAEHTLYRAPRVTGDKKEGESLGTWYSSDQSVALYYSGGNKELVKEIKVRIKNPLIVKPADEEFPEMFSQDHVNKILKEAKVKFKFDNEDDQEFWRFVDSGGKKLTSQLKKAGYDSLQFPDSLGNKIFTSTLVFNSQVLTTNPAWVKDHTKWKQAKEQAHKEGKGTDYAYITGIYKQMGGEISNNSIEESMNDWLIYNAGWTQEQRDALPSEDFAGPNQSFPIKSQQDVYDAARLIGHADNPEAVKHKIIAIAKHKGFKIPDAWMQSTNNSNTTMNEKANIITWLTTNCSCMKDKKQHLEGLTDNALKEVILENAEKAVENDADQMFLNWISNADKDIRNAISTYVKGRIGNAFGKGNQPNKNPQQQDTTGSDSDTSAAMDAEMKKKQMMMQQTANNNQVQNNEPKTIDEFVKRYPFLSGLVANHNANENAEKQQLIGRITAPITDNTAKQQAVTTLNTKSVDELRTIAMFVPQPQQQQTQSQTIPFAQPVVNFFGATGGNPQITDNSYLQKEVLTTNSPDWKEWAKNTSIYDNQKG